MIPKIQIQTTPGQIQVSQGPARITTTNRPAELSISSPDAQVSIQNGSSSLEINWRQTRNEMDLMHYMDFQRKFRDESLQAGLEGIGRIVSEGHIIGDIENGGTPISSLAMERTNHEKDFGMGFVPKTPPDVTITVREPRLDSEYQKVQIRPQIFPATHRVVPTLPTVNVVSNPKVDIDFLGQFVDLLVP